MKCIWAFISSYTDLSWVKPFSVSVLICKSWNKLEVSSSELSSCKGKCQLEYFWGSVNHHCCAIWDYFTVLRNVFLSLGLFWAEMLNRQFLLIKRKDMFALTAHKYWRKLLQMKSCTSSPLHWHSVTTFLTNTFAQMKFYFL